VQAATEAFKTGPWKRFTSSQRAQCLLKFADLLEAHVERFAKLEVLAMGQPIALAKPFSGPFIASIFRYYAGWATQLSGEYYPNDDGDGYDKIVRYEPLGVCAGLAAWNGTFLSVAWKIAPAVAAGNTIIFKASEKSPLGALALGDLVKEAGFPPGVINFVTGAGKTGDLLASHMGIAKVSFTGSVATGRKVQEAALKSNMKRVTLELGGKSPSIVFKDADMDNALTHNSQGFLANSAQACTAGSRVLVQEDIAAAFVAGLKARFEGLGAAMGDPMDPQTFLGPVADRQQYDRVMGFIDQGKQDGAELVCGGNRKGDKGWFIEPTIFLNPPSDSAVYRDEIFGPVITVRTFKTEEEAVALANDTVYGLSCKARPPGLPLGGSIFPLTPILTG
jgi:aldehyde dehydrogenase (NAD+)